MIIKEQSQTIIIEDLGLGEIILSHFGSDYIFEVVSTYDGSTIGQIVCEGVKEFICENSLNCDRNETIFGSFIPVTVIKPIDSIIKEKLYNHSYEKNDMSGFLLTMGEADVNIRVVCLLVNIKIDKVETYKQYFVKKE